jgi:aminobenzoyl-glutamate utilization protein B
MKHLPALLLMLFIHQQLFSQKTDLSPAKKNAIESVDKHQAELTALSDSVWSYAETALKEYQSSKILSDYAENQGFKVTRNVADYKQPLLLNMAVANR